MKKPHYAWAVCAACTLLTFCIMGLSITAFSVFSPYLLAAGGLTNTQVSLLTTARALFSLLATFVATEIYNGIGTRLSCLISGLMAAAGVALFGLTHSFLGYCAASAIIGFSYGISGMLLISVIISRWFESHRGLALAICSAGSGLSAIVGSPIAVELIEKHSLDFAFFAEAAFIAAAAVVVFAVVRPRPQDMGLRPLSAPEGKTPRARPAPKSSPLRVTDKRAVSLACASMVLMCAICGPGYANVSLLLSTNGYSAMRIAALLSLLGAALTVGKLIYGQLCDKAGTRGSSRVLFALCCAAGALLCFPGSGAAATGGIVSLGAGATLETVSVPLFAADLSAPEDFVSTLKKFQLSVMAGLLLFYPTPGIIADLSGSYVPVYAVFAATSAASFALIELAYAAARRKAASV